MGTLPAHAGLTFGEPVAPTNMNCDEYLDWVAADVDGLLGDRTEETRHHLDECPRCRALRAACAEVRALLHSRRLTQDAPLGLRTRILARLDDEVPRGARTRLFRWTAVATAALALLVIFFLHRTERIGNDATEVYQLILDGALRPVVETSIVAELEDHYARHGRGIPSHVVNLEPQGFRLTGGLLYEAEPRLLRLSVYSDGQHVIVCDYRSLDSWSGRLPSSSEPLFVTKGGLNLCIRRMGREVCVLATRMPMDLFRTKLLG